MYCLLNRERFYLCKTDKGKYFLSNNSSLAVYIRDPKRFSGQFCGEGSPVMRFRSDNGLYLLVDERGKQRSLVFNQGTSFGALMPGKFYRVRNSHYLCLIATIVISNLVFLISLLFLLVFYRIKSSI